MSLKLYYDLLSQPSRALYIFLKVCKIPFESKIVNLGNGEHLQPGFKKIHRFNKVPAIEHNGFNLIERTQPESILILSNYAQELYGRLCPDNCPVHESIKFKPQYSVAIMRYLCREFKVDEHWYPRDSNSQAKVDEYLEWQHLNTRVHCALYFQIKFLIPLLEGRPPKPEKVAKFEGRMIDCLDQIENIWLKDTPFLIGDKISIADILGACEVEQPRMAGYNPRDGRPKLSAWLDRVAKETSPYYEEAHKHLNKLAARFDQKESKL